MTDERLKVVKYINDPVYGGIAVTKMELEIIDTPIFQRLRGLRQLARVNLVFPSAEHSRYVHSLGVLYIMGLMTEHLLKQGMLSEDDVIKMRVAALLHDIGHYPLSHLGESVYSYCKDNENATNIVELESKTDEKHLYEITSSHSKSAHHEHLGKYIVINHHEISGILKKYGLNPVEIGEIFTGKYGSRNMVYTQLLHSSLDADRLDYLLRDSYQTLMSRYFHYSQVIFHKTNAAFEGMIKCMYIKLVQSGNFIYKSLDEIHAHINEEEFLKFNDSFLEVSLKEYYDKTDDEEYKRLYEMYRDRIRPKVVFELKDLYEDSREAVKLYNPDSGEISYLAGDKLSIVSKLANYKSEFIRIYVLEEKGKAYNYEKMHQDIKALITS